ncbi:hypothetical protein HYU11_04335 [Candidatus Woesearchaeota archaeon]|nr:hypothetical protein [Candidatus Woesearchaeota archaeon]
MQPKIISETPISMSELKEGVSRIKKKSPDLSFRVKKTEEYLTSFDLLSPKSASEMFEKINALGVPRLRDMHICKIIDLMPIDANDLKTILQGYTITVSNENLKKIADIVKEYA